MVSKFIYKEEPKTIRFISKTSHREKVLETRRKNRLKRKNKKYDKRIITKRKTHAGYEIIGFGTCIPRRTNLERG